MFAVTLTFGPLVVVGASMFGRHQPSWNDWFELLCVSWLVEIVAAPTAALLIGRLKDARERPEARTSWVELLFARLAFWTALLLSLALPCAVAWVFMMGFAMAS